MYHYISIISSVYNKILLFFSCSVVSDCLQSYGLQHARLPCPSLFPGVCSNSCPLSPWCWERLFSRSVVSNSLWPPWIAALLSITNSQSLLKLMSIESVMPSNHLILCRPLLLPSIFPIFRFFSYKSALSITWTVYVNYILIKLLLNWIELKAVIH